MLVEGITHEHDMPFLRMILRLLDLKATISFPSLVENACPCQPSEN